MIKGKDRNPQGACATSYERVNIHEYIVMSAYSNMLTRVHHKLANAGENTLPIPVERMLRTTSSQCASCQLNGDLRYSIGFIYV